MTDQIDITKSKFLKAVFFALVGFLTGAVSYVPIVFLFIIISVDFAASKGRNNSSTIDDFLLMWFYAIPAVVLSTLLGGIGGMTRIFRNKYVGAIIGSLLGNVLVVSIMAIRIISGWHK